VGEAVWQDGRRFTPAHRRGVGYVFQEPSLFPHLSVRGNLAFAVRRAAETPGPDFDEVVRMMGLEQLLDRSPAALSGGERQRAAIGRALLSRPSLLLMDEPLSSLDADAKGEVLPFLDELHRRLALPVIYVSHDAGEVARLADRVLRMRHGRIEGLAEVAGGDPLELLSPSQVSALARAALAAGLEVER
jgi:molybdate transport system ATP-binding protein